jgi:hypothetical protein
MTKEELIRLVILELGGGNTPASVEAKYTPQMVEKTVELAFDDLCYQAYAYGLKTGIYDNLDMYVRAYRMNVLTDTTRDEKYSVIPVKSTSIPDTVALRQLSPTKGQRLAFAPIENYSLPVWNELEVNQVDNRVSFYIENGRIYYDEKLPQEITEVLGKIVVPFSAFQDTDSVFVPFGQNTALFTQIVQILSRQTQPSNNDDMTSKQV